MSWWSYCGLIVFKCKCQQTIRSYKEGERKCNECPAGKTIFCIDFFYHILFFFVCFFNTPYHTLNMSVDYIYSRSFSLCILHFDIYTLWPHPWFICTLGLQTLMTLASIRLFVFVSSCSFRWVSEVLYRVHTLSSWKVHRCLESRA